jgi:predicted small secreted protein
MGKLVLLLTMLLASCSHKVMNTVTGHGDQHKIIDSALQNALEYNADGIVTYWHDPNTGKSGTIKPLYASYDWAPPCRHFEMAHFYPDKSPTYHYGQACKRGQLWRIH